MSFLVPKMPQIIDFESNSSSEIDSSREIPTVGISWGKGLILQQYRINYEQQQQAV